MRRILTTLAIASAITAIGYEHDPSGRPAGAHPDHAVTGHLISTYSISPPPGLIPHQGIVSMRSDGDGFRDIESTARIESPPRGGKIAYTVAGGRAVVVAALEGGVRTLIDTIASGVTGFDVDSPALSMDGSRIAYVRIVERPDNTRGTELWVAGSDGSARHLIDTGIVRWSTPAFSPAAPLIAYMACRSGKPACLYVAPLDGREPPTVVAKDVEPSIDWSYELDGANWISWDPKGRMILYETYDGPAKTVAEVNIFTGEEALLAHGSYATFSPDGSRIAFSTVDGEPGCTVDIGVMDADGGRAMNLTQTPHCAELFPQWSPDGGRIVCTVHDWFRGPGPYYGDGYCKVIDATTGDVIAEANPRNPSSRWFAGGFLKLFWTD